MRYDPDMPDKEVNRLLKLGCGTGGLASDDEGALGSDDESIAHKDAVHRREYCQLAGHRCTSQEEHSRVRFRDMGETLKKSCGATHALARKSA